MNKIYRVSPDQTLSTPVLFMIFNRPDVTQRVFDEIQKAKPIKLFVAADGPREQIHDDANKCQATRDIINQVDWDCEVIKNYSDINLGCGRCVSSSINWVFEEVEEAIILEDDCLPAPSFFHFCQELLDKYRDDKRIMHIGGNNFQFGQNRTNYSNYFSKYTHCWGWASWRRAWKHFDHNMKTWPEFKKNKMIKSVCKDPYEQEYWTRIFDRMLENAPVPDIWDYQWLYACWSQNGLSVIPNVNLVSNIGFGPDSTHCKDGKSSLAELSTTDIWKIAHPQIIVRDRDADIFTFDHVYGGKQMKERDTLKWKIRQHSRYTKRKVIAWLDRFLPVQIKTHLKAWIRGQASVPYD